MDEVHNGPLAPGARSSALASFMHFALDHVALESGLYLEAGSHVLNVTTNVAALCVPVVPAIPTCQNKVVHWPDLISCHIHGWFNNATNAQRLHQRLYS